MMFKTIIILLLISLQSYGYVRNKTVYGDNVSWSNSEINIYVHTDNNSGISSSKVLEIVREVLGQNGIAGWQSYANLNINVRESSERSKAGRNDIYFYANDIDFNGNCTDSSGVVGKTTTVYNHDNGDIAESDIVLNDNCTFNSNDTSNEMYLGNVIAHELGHLFGMAHSQVSKATMFYLLNQGQNELHNDDEAGIYSVYPTSSSKGKITGKIIGGDELIGVFGAHVIAISTESGQMYAGAISDEGGTFEINGLDLNDTYYLYIEPLEYVETLPEYYIYARKDYCQSGNSYRGSFFQSCLSSNKGYPHGIELTASNKNVEIGNITIRCSLDVPNYYIDDKVMNSSQFKTYDSANGKVGNALVGFFTQDEFNNQNEDTFNIDLTEYDVPAGNIYLDIKLISQSLYSPVKLLIEVEDFNSVLLSNAHGSGYKVDEYGIKSLDIVERYSLTQGVSTDNYFTLRIQPDSLQYSTNYFLDYSNFIDDSRFYMLLVTISSESNGQYRVISKKYYNQTENNNSCPDGSNTYTVLANKSVRQSNSSRKDKDDGGFLGCGTINMSGQGRGPDGQVSFTIGFLILFVLIRFKNWILENNNCE